MDFATAEEKFYALMGRLAAGVITQDDFRARLEELIVQDDQGRTWMLGAQSGKWYRYDGKRWVQDTPPRGDLPLRRTSPSAETMIAPAPPPVSETDIHPPSEERCPRCDHALIAGATFCDRCGLRLPGDTAAYSSADVAEIATEPCPKCGRPLPTEAPFCAGCGYRRPKARSEAAPPPPPPSIGEPFAVPPPPPPPPPLQADRERPTWLNWLVLGLMGALILCCLATAALALFWPDSPVSLMNLLGGPAGPTPTTEPTQTITFITPTFTVGAPAPTAMAPTAAAPTIVATAAQPSGPTLTPTEPPPTRVRTPAAPTPPPLPTVTSGPTRTPVPPTAAGPRFRLKETRLIEEKFGLGYIHVFVLDQNGQGIQGIQVRIDGGDPTSWKLDVTTDVRGLAEFNALSASVYNITLVDYGVVAPGIDRTNKNWEVVFEAY